MLVCVRLCACACFCAPLYARSFFCVVASGCVYARVCVRVRMCARVSVHGRKCTFVFAREFVL